jgi:hypothetical protein
MSNNLRIPNIEIKRNEIKTKRVSPLISIDKIKPSKREKTKTKNEQKKSHWLHFYIGRYGR